MVGVALGSKRSRVPKVSDMQRHLHAQATANMLSCCSIIRRVILW